MTNAVPAKERIEKALASCIMLVAGYLDGYGLLVLGTYVSFMSGNTTMTGVRAGQGSFLAALLPAIAIVGFVAGSAAGNLIKHSRLRHAPTLLFILITALLAAVAAMGGPGELKRVDVALLSFAMGMVNPVLPKIGAETVSLTFMTGTLSRIGGHLGLAVVGAPVPGSEGAWDTHLYRARMDAELWASFVIGAALSGVAISVSREYALRPAIAVMLFIALATSYAETREAEKGPSTAAEMGPLEAEPIAPPVSGERASEDRGAERVK
jgi:uncharacterized membrane protein YoaK (UPF0700 family)